MLTLGSLPVRTPFPWEELLRYLSFRLTPELERIERGSYVRRIGGRTVTVSFDAREKCLCVTADGRVKADEVMRRVAALFDVEHDPAPVARHLRRFAPFAPRLKAVPGMRPLGAWSSFELCVRTILGQQVTVAAAGTLMRRLVQRCGEITPATVSAADYANFGMPGKRVETLRTFARAVRDESVCLHGSWSQVDAALRELPGFGPWTRAYLAIRLGREPDAFPESDLGLIRAAQVDSPRSMLAAADEWRPYRACAATYLWAVNLPA